MSRKPFCGLRIHRDMRRDDKPTLGELAANLYQVYDGTAPAEYREPDLFDRHNFETESMKLVMGQIKKKLKEGKGDPFINIVTPFGGGKTHAMIAAFHKAGKWRGIRTVVIVGTNMDESMTLWGELERQLNDDSIDSMVKKTSPGVNKLVTLLERNQPVLILIDEMLDYDIKAAGVSVGETTLATQTTYFIQELGDAALALDRVCIVVSFPSNSLEFPGDPKTVALADGLLNDLRRVAQRQEHPVSPMGLEDVPEVVRRRLFDAMDSDSLPDAAEAVIEKYVKWCTEEGLIQPDDTDRYEERFKKSYPFTPDVIDTLYNKWGSFKSFQRTRGVLRLLALVIHSLRNSTKQYVTLADFDLTDTTLRQMLMSYTGHQTNSVLRNDITGNEAIACRTKHGTRCATTVFMMSYAMDGSAGATMADVKRAVATPDYTMSPEVADSMDWLRRHLHYMREDAGVYRFTHELNMNSVMDTMLDNVSDDEVREMERSFLQEHAGSSAFVWPDSSMEIPEDGRIKYVLLRDDDVGLANNMIQHRGSGTRLFKNSVIVICPNASKRGTMARMFKSIKVRNTILDDTKKYALKSSDKSRLKNELREYENNVATEMLNYYSIVYVPSQTAPERISSIQRGGHTVVECVRNQLLNEHIHDKIDPELLISCLGDASEVRTAPIYENMLNAPGGRLRPVGRSVIRDSIIRGVREGKFALGYRNDDGIELRYDNQTPTVTFEEDEYILRNPQLYHKEKQVGLPEKPHTSKRQLSDPEEFRPKFHEFRMDLRVNNISELQELLGKLDTFEFSRKKRVVVECTEGDISEAKFNALKESCLKLDAKARVTPNV